MKLPRFISARGRITGALLLALFASVTPTFAQPKKILFLSGPKDHGVPGRHEYVLDLKTLAESFEKATNLKGVTTEHLVGKAPTDMAVYKDVAAIVIESSSDRDPNETHPLFPVDPRLSNGARYSAETTAFLRSLNDLIKANKIGVVFIHYSNWTENSAARTLYFEWTGGLWVNSVSRNPVDQWTMTPDPEAKGHPIWNGVKPWSYRDEVFCRFMLPVDKRRTNLVVASPLQDPQHIGAQVASFAVQRDDGGRGFVYGGMDFRDTLANDDYRRFLMNGIAWAAHVDIPAEGILSPTPDVSDMTPASLPRVGGPVGGANAGMRGAPPATPAKTN